MSRAVLGDKGRRRGRSRAIKALPNIIDAQPLSSPHRATGGRRLGRLQTRLGHHYHHRRRTGSNKGSSPLQSNDGSFESASPGTTTGSHTPHSPSTSPPSPDHRSSTPCAGNDYHLSQGAAQPIDTPTRRPSRPPPHPTMEVMELSPKARRFSQSVLPSLELDDAWHCAIDLDPDQHLEEQPLQPKDVVTAVVSVQCVTQDLDNFAFDSEVEEDDTDNGTKPQRGRRSSASRTSRAPDGSQRSISASRGRRKTPGHSRAGSKSQQGEPMKLTEAEQEQASDHLRFFGEMSGPVTAQGESKSFKDRKMGYARQRSSTVGLLSPIQMTRIGPLRNSSPGEQRRQQHSVGPPVDQGLYPDTPFVISGIPAATNSEHTPSSSDGTPLPSPILHYARVASSTASTESLPLAPQPHQQMQGVTGQRRKTISFALAPGTNPDSPRFSKVGKTGRALSRAATQRHGQQLHSRYQEQSRRDGTMKDGQLSWTDSWNQHSHNGHNHGKVLKRRDSTGSGFSTPVSYTTSPGLSPIRSRPPPQSNSAAMATTLSLHGGSSKKSKVRGGSVSSTTSLESLPWIRHLEGGPPSHAGGNTGGGRRSRQTSFNWAWAFAPWLDHNKTGSRRGAVDVTPPSEEDLMTPTRLMSHNGLVTADYKAPIGVRAQGQDEAAAPRVSRPSFHHRACSSDQVLPMLSKVSALASTTTAVSHADTGDSRKKKRYARRPSDDDSFEHAAPTGSDDQDLQKQSTPSSSTFLAMFGHQGRPRSQSDLTIRLKGTLAA